MKMDMISADEFKDLAKVALSGQVAQVDELFGIIAEKYRTTNIELSGALASILEDAPRPGDFFTNSYTRPFRGLANLTTKSFEHLYSVR